MDLGLLKQIFPFSFGEKKDVAGLVMNILIYVVGGLVAGFIIGLPALLPLIGGILGVIAGLIGTLGEIYVIAGIVLSVLDYLKILK